MGHDHFPEDENVHLGLLACGSSFKPRRIQPTEFLNHLPFYGEAES